MPRVTDPRSPREKQRDTLASRIANPRERQHFLDLWNNGDYFGRRATEYRARAWSVYRDAVGKVGA